MREASSILFFFEKNKLQLTSPQNHAAFSLETIYFEIKKNKKERKLAAADTRVR